LLSLVLLAAPAVSSAREHLQVYITAPYLELRSGPGRGYPVAVRRRWLGLIAVVVAAATGVTVAAVSRGESKPPKPAHANPAKQYGDDADLMRRLERNKLVKKTK